MLKILCISIVLISLITNYGYSQNLLKNPGFETGSLLPYWVSYPKGLTTSSVIDSNNAFEGEFCTEIESGEVYFYQPVNLEPNTEYRISAAIKSQYGDSVMFGVSNVDREGGESRYLLYGTGYEMVSLSFTTDESPGNQPNIFIWKDDGTGKVWVDSIVMVIVPEIIQPKPPGGFGTFYVSPQGNDSNAGTSPGQPWQTINKVNSIDFGPGDRILFEGGKSFYGTIVLNKDDYGTLDNKVHVDSYGTGRSIINALSGSGFIAYDCSNISIKNLNFVGDGRLDGNTGNGITFSYCTDIIIDSIEVSGFQHSGLMVNNIGDNYQITNVNAHDNGYAGIYMSGIAKGSLSNIYIGYCTADNNPGDPTVTDNHSGNGIFAYNASSITIEFCKASYNGGDMPWNENGPGGIWVAEVDSVIIQHCISHNNKTSPYALDGLGFDLDGGTTNSVIQYCLSYNNEGAGFGIFQYAGASDWYNNTIRYCISENDGNVTAPGSVYFWNGTPNSNQFHGFEFYNNVVYNTNGAALAFLDHKNSNFNFRNNIFVSKISGVYSRISGENSQGNCWYSLNNPSSDSLNFISWMKNNNQEMLEAEIIGMFANPMLVNPGFSNLTDPTMLTTVDDYKIGEGSTLVDAGLDLTSLFNIDPGNQDYFGNPLNQVHPFNIGIYQNLDKQEISLSPGWNILSFKVMPNDSNLENIFQPLIDNEILKKVMNEEGNTIEDWGIYGDWQNAIGNLENTEGYKVNLTSEASLQIAGVPTQIPFDIFLNTGWNLISWPLGSEQDGMDVFQSLINNGKLKKVMDEEGNTIEDWGVYGDWQNGIGTFKPGEGYKVNVTEDCILTINEIGTKSKVIVPKRIPSTHFKPAFTGNGTDHMNINLVNLSESGIMEGDEIGIFDGSICVGSVQISNLQSAFVNNQSIFSISVSAADGIESKNGYSEGNPITVKLFRNGKEFPVFIESLSNDITIFSKGSSLYAQLALPTGIEGIINGEFTDVKIYPNPFSEEVNIEINLAEDAEVEIVVLNILGQKIKYLATKQNIPAGKNNYTWNGSNNKNGKVSPGIYNIHFNVNDNSFVRKIILR